MVVEDHDLIREALSATLQAEPDIEVVACCPDGQAAIVNLDQASPDVVVTDLSLPRVDGVAVTAHLCRHRRGVPVVVFTSAPHGHRAAAARAAGAYTVLGKSSDPSAVVAAVRVAAGMVRLGPTSTRRFER
jgi:DNA-binding NarL/FixJ family response regulator